MQMTIFGDERWILLREDFRQSWLGLIMGALTMPTAGLQQLYLFAGRYVKILLRELSFSAAAFMQQSPIGV